MSWQYEQPLLTYNQSGLAYNNVGIVAEMVADSFSTIDAVINRIAFDDEDAFSAIDTATQGNEASTGDNTSFSETVGMVFAMQVADTFVSSDSAVIRIAFDDEDAFSGIDGSGQMLGNNSPETGEFSEALAFILRKNIVDTVSWGEDVVCTAIRGLVVSDTFTGSDISSAGIDIHTGEDLGAVDRFAEQINGNDGIWTQSEFLGKYDQPILQSGRLF